jgi:hypothetical protein
VSTTTTYYHKGTPGEQGSVIDKQTGRTVAVVYDAKDAPLLAAAPALLTACKAALQYLMDTNPLEHGNPTLGGVWRGLEDAIADTETDTDADTETE